MYLCLNLLEYNADARKHVTSELKGDVMVIRINTPGAKVCIATFMHNNK